MKCCCEVVDCTRGRIDGRERELWSLGSTGSFLPRIITLLGKGALALSYSLVPVEIGAGVLDFGNLDGNVFTDVEVVSRCVEEPMFVAFRALLWRVK